MTIDGVVSRVVAVTLVKFSMECSSISFSPYSMYFRAIEVVGTIF